MFRLIITVILAGVCSGCAQTVPSKADKIENTRIETAQKLPPETPPLKKAEERLQGIKEEHSLLAQRNRAYALNYFILAKTQYEDLRIEEAKENLKLSLRYDPECRDALDLFEKVQALLGERPDKVKVFFQWAEKERKVKIQQRKIEIENLISKGKDRYEKGAYNKAAKMFRSALQLIRWMPYYVDMGEVKKEAEERLEKAEGK